MGIGILFRPNIITNNNDSSSFKEYNISALNCDYKRPINTNDDNNLNQQQQLAITNIYDIIREIQYIGKDIITDVKVLIRDDDDDHYDDDYNLGNKKNKLDLDDKDDNNSTSSSVSLIV